MKYYQSIKSRRLELGISQHELAEQLGYKSRTTIAKIEAGKSDIPVGKLFEFAKILDIAPEALLSGFKFDSLQDGTEIKPKLRNRVAALILAGGHSYRNQMKTPNQFVNIYGKPTILYALEEYEKHPAIDEVYIVCLKGWEDVLFSYCQKAKISKMKKIVPAGNTGIVSICNGIKAMMNSGYGAKDIVVVQESTRPMVTGEMISNVLALCMKKGSAVICEPMDDAVQFLVKKSSWEYINREKLISLQSPEAYHIDMLIDVFKKAQEQNKPMKGNCLPLLLNELGFKQYHCEGIRNNIKIVRQEDIAVAKALLKDRA